MSGDDDVELKDMLLETLKLNGALARVRALLRASIFHAFEEDGKNSNQQYHINNKMKACLDTTEGKLMFSVVREFLEFFNLDYTISVFDPESCLGLAYKYDRGKLKECLGLDDQDPTVPLLLQLIRFAQNKRKTVEVNLNVYNLDEESNLSNIEESILSEISEESSLRTESEKEVLADEPEHKSSVEENGINLSSEKRNGTFNISDSNNHLKPSKSLLSDSNIDLSMNSRNNSIILPETKNKFEASLEKIKNSTSKFDKLKAKNALNDSPLSPNVCRNADIYSKEFRERPSPKRSLDDFEVSDPAYEEDFISESLLNQTFTKNDSKNSRFLKIKNDMSSLADLPGLPDVKLRITSDLNDVRKFLDPDNDLDVDLSEATYSENSKSVSDERSKASELESGTKLNGIVTNKSLNRTDDHL